jgi:hypothetical protein
MGIVTGKQARVVDEPARTKHDNTPPKQQQTAKTTMPARSSEPTLPTSSAAAAHHDPVQPQAVDIKTKHNKRIPDENIAKLVAEENESKSKFPHYPGLERWELIEKMGDGAFSNVYRARDREGDAGEVAIKVVRKFEMNSMQVRDMGDQCFSFASPFSLACGSSSLSVRVPFTDSRCISRATNIFIPTLSQRPQGLQRCEESFLCHIRVCLCCRRLCRRLPAACFYLPSQAPGMLHCLLRAVQCS